MRKIGIDFGNCNIKGAAKKKNGDVSYIKLGKIIDKPRIPNVILYEKKKERIKYYIGNMALNQKSTSAQDLIKGIKSHLQEEDWSRTLSFGKTVKAYDVVCDIMAALYEEIHSTNKNEEISVVITVPVNFSKRQQQMVEKAAGDAGFVVDAVITEPFAALFYLMRDELDAHKRHNVLVFDFGGGTLDLCLAEIRDKAGTTRIETQATVGISYGGNNINEDILEHIIKRKAPEAVKKVFEKQENILRQEVNRYLLMQSLESAKEELFADEDTEETEIEVILYDGQSVNLGTVSVSEVYQMFQDDGWDIRMDGLLNKLFDDSAALIPPDVTDVFLIGGSSSIPYFRDRIAAYFKKHQHPNLSDLFERNDEMDPDEKLYTSVSAGAAIYHEIIEENEIEVVDRIPFLIYAKDDQGKKCAKISLDVSYKGCASPLAPITEGMKKQRRIGVYQTIFGEIDREVFLGYILLDDDIVSNATLFRLAVDKKRTIRMEFGYLIEDLEDTKSAFCRDWRIDLEIKM